MMLHITQAVIVEGKYDKMRLERICDAPVFTTEGFRIFKDKQKREFFTRVAKKRGLIILTDSDRAGFLIRNKIKGLCGIENAIHAYIPEVFGKEKRKASPSKEGKIGVEGMDDSVLFDILSKYSCKEIPKTKVSKSDLLDCGLYGGTKSAADRCVLCRYLGIPVNISVNALLDAVNILLTREEFFETVVKLCTKDTDNG